MATVVRMPSVLAGATEAAIANWLVSPGDTVTVGTPIAEIETEKALVEYAAEEAGVIGRLVLGVGDTGEIGDPIAVLVSGNETDADIDVALGRAPSGADPRVTAPSAPATPGSPGNINDAVNASSAAVSAASSENINEAVNSSLGTGGDRTRVFASPLVRKIAGEKGIDLAELAGTGPNGRIVRRDLEGFLVAQAARPAQPVRVTAVLADAGATGTGAAQAEQRTVTPTDFQSTAAAAPVPAASAGAHLIPHTPMRRAIARRLAESKATVPHFYMVTECVVDALLALRKEINGSSPTKISVNDFVIMAVAAAFRDVPEANVTWSEEGLLAHENVDISIAVATEGGLVTPVLRGVERLRLSQVARSAADLAGRARDRRLRQDEIEGGTFAISNLGMYGTVEFSAIINPPQSGILAVGAARQQPVAVDGAVTVATVLRCTLSVDHRAIDGALAARWLAAFTTRLQNPLAAII